MRSGAVSVTSTEKRPRLNAIESSSGSRAATDTATPPGTGSAARARAVSVVVTVIVAGAAALAERIRVTVRCGSLQCMTNTPPAKLAVEPGFAMLHCQSPGVIGASRQFAAGLGAAAAGTGAGAAAGAGRGGAGTQAVSRIAAAKNGMVRIELALERWRGFAFMRSLWNDAPSISSAQAR